MEESNSNNLKENLQNDLSTKGIVDYRQRVESAFSQIRQLLSEVREEILSQEWRRIQKFSVESKFSVAIVGEFSRGKSTLVNQLLGEEIVPIGAVPTTSIITRIVFGKEPILKAVRLNNEIEDYTLTSETWDLIFNIDQSYKMAIVEIPNENIRVSDLYIYDTPGAGDLEGDKAQATIDIIAGCNAVLMVVNASMALSLTERAFLEQHIFSKKIPKIVIVISHLDIINPNERIKVLEYVRSKLKEWQAPAAVLTTFTELSIEEQELVDGHGIKALWKFLNEWSTDPEHQQLRALQVGSQLYDLLQRYGELVKIQMGNVVEEEKKQFQIHGEKKQQIERQRLDWEDIRLELLQRNNKLLTWLEKSFRQYQPELFERLSHDLSQTYDPKKWWQETMPYSLRNELLHFGKTISEQLNERISNDFIWLDQVAQKRLGWRIEPSKPPTMTFEKSPTTVSGEEDGLNLHRIQILSRLGIAAATIIGYVLYGPLGIAISVGGGLASELFINKSIKTQKQQLQVKLGNLIDTHSYLVLNNITERIMVVFEKVLQTLKDQENLWYLARENALNEALNKPNEDQQVALKDKLEKISHIQEQLKLT